MLRELILHPLSYSIRVANVRRANLKQFPYHLNYLLHGEAIVIVSELHHRRGWLGSE